MVRLFAVLAWMVVCSVATAQVGGYGKRTPTHGNGTAFGSVGFVNSRRNLFVRDAAEVTLMFEGSSRTRERVQSDATGDYSFELKPGRYCVSAFDKNGQPLKLAKGQVRCIRVAADKDTRFDVMLESGD